MSDYTMIDQDRQLEQYAGELKSRGVFEVAMDFEGEFNVHVYGEKLCLIQLFDGERTVLIDPFKVSPGAIKTFLENRNLLKIMYDAMGDQSLVRKQYDIAILSILDLKPAVEMLALEKQDLGSVLEARLGIPPGNKRRFQMYNWMTRPIAKDALQYAISDVTHLYALRDSLLGEIVEKGDLPRYILENAKVQNKPPGPDKGPGVLRSGRFFKLSKDQQALFRRMYEARDVVAQKLNLPPNTVLANSAMFDLARRNVQVSTLKPSRNVGAGEFATLLDEIDRLINLG